MSQRPIIVWFRRDLRLKDNPALKAALQTGSPIICLFIHDDDYETRPLGAASKWWLHHSLKVLDQELGKFGSRLILRLGQSESHLIDIIGKYQVTDLFCSFNLDPTSVEKDRILREKLLSFGVKWHAFNGTHLNFPLTTKTKNERNYQVFTPYAKAVRLSWPNEIVFTPETINSKHFFDDKDIETAPLESAGLYPALPPSGLDWSLGFNPHMPGELGAHEALKSFVESKLSGYANGRDRPDLDVCSNLSAHLRFGEISPWRVVKAIQQADASPENKDKFISELLWREFSYDLLHQVPALHMTNFKAGFNGFEWQNDPTDFRKWCRGETGYDLVDAGMKQLWQTGFMHNRIRMICASFLCKHLLIDWRWGEQWFWDTLLDADPANNPASWQWVAGCGADAAPYFRIFNPITAAEKFDSDGRYRRRYLTRTLDSLPPIIDHLDARNRALESFRSLK